MLKKMCVTIAAMVPMLAVQAMANEPVDSKFKLSVGGFVKLDYTYNSTAVGPYYPQNTIPAKGTDFEKRNETVLTARQSRFWLKANGPELLGAKTSSLIEADFYGTGSLSNEFGNMRMRLAYATLDWPDTQVLFGQFWEIWSPVPGNTLDFRQAGPNGAAANPRVPQIRVTQKFTLNTDNFIKLAVAVQNPVQDSPLAGNPGSTSINPSLGTSGSYGNTPNAGFQLSYVSKALGVAPGFWGMPMKPLEVGVFALGGKQQFLDNKNVNIHGVGAWAFVPVLKSTDGKSRKMTLSLEGQAYTASGLAVNAVNTVQLVGTKPNQHAPNSFGLLGQAVFYPTQEWGITAGYGRRGVTHSSDYSNNNERSQYLAFVNTAYDFNAAVRVAAEYEHAKSDYFGIPNAPGAGQQVGATADSGQINTFRLCAMYFF